MAGLNYPSESTHDVRLGLEVHGQIRVRPVADHAEADKVTALPIYLLRRVGPAGGAKLARAHPATHLADGLFDLMLDRQAMAVPAGHIGGIEAVHGTCLDDNVLEYFVDGVAI